jgi:hypothetical protein
VKASVYFLSYLPKFFLEWEMFQTAVMEKVKDTLCVQQIVSENPAFHEIMWTNTVNLVFCWPCIIVFQYNATNVMHFSFSLLRIKGLYMFRALLAHPRRRYTHGIWYCIRMSVGCDIITVLTNAAPPEDEQVILETCRGSWYSINWTKSASRWFQYTQIR